MRLHVTVIVSKVRIFKTLSATILRKTFTKVLLTTFKFFLATKFQKKSKYDYKSQEIRFQLEKLDCDCKTSSFIFTRTYWGLFTSNKLSIRIRSPQAISQLQKHQKDMRKCLTTGANIILLANTWFFSFEGKILGSISVNLAKINHT
ncbi:hypothetical protein KIN20_035867 [Parelaphostrongylus tenuis]|uniref:Uncharacterized protein n=1 Tax=Parelaphostrongylus tenuis TaxID=148309 RepID=A0AAD5RCF3_PARTN|nr:hypothetical protein KIN20_035867 [Parelaphostrongylus tenuis]